MNETLVMVFELGFQAKIWEWKVLSSPFLEIAFMGCYPLSDAKHHTDEELRLFFSLRCLHERPGRQVELALSFVARLSQIHDPYGGHKVWGWSVKDGL